MKKFYTIAFSGAGFILPLVLLMMPLRTSAVEPAATEEDPYSILMDEAEKAIADKNYEEAAARLIDALGVNPTNPANLIVKTNLGLVYSELGRDSLAIATLSDVISKEPRMTAAILNRGRLNLKVNRTDSAVADFSRVLEIDSVNAEALYFRGMISLYGGNREAAETDFNILKATRPESQSTFRALATLYSMTGREREAAEYFQKLIEHEAAPEYYAALAGCYLAIDELSEASSTISDGLKLYPLDPELYYYRAWLNRERFRYDDARDDAAKAIRYGASKEKVKSLFKKK